MTHFTGDYYVFEDELYRKVKMTPKGYQQKKKKGNVLFAVGTCLRNLTTYFSVRQIESYPKN